MIVALVYDLFVILTVGLISGIVCKRLGFSMLVGYLLAGAVVGQGGFDLVAEGTEEIEYLAVGSKNGRDRVLGGGVKKLGRRSNAGD